jgi:diguanylate cyclase (GGDEF)-like protein
MSTLENPLTLLPQILDDLPIGLMLLEPIYQDEKLADFRWLFINQLAAQLMTTDAQTVVGKQLLEHAPHLKESSLFEKLLQAMESCSNQSFEQFLSAEQSLSRQDVWYAINAQPQQSYLVVTFENITKRKEFEGYVRQMAFQDELTGIYNRRYFRSRVPSLISLARREGWSCALLYLDLNGFKTINDTFGHSEGDQLLRAIAWRLDANCREGEIFFRSGGDEFALFMPKADITAGLGAAKRIAGELALPFTLNENSHRIGASIGVAVMPSKEASLDIMLERADHAMYAAKQRKGELSAISLWTPDTDS